MLNATEARALMQGDMWKEEARQLEEYISKKIREACRGGRSSVYIVFDNDISENAIAAVQETLTNKGYTYHRVTNHFCVKWG